MSNGWKSARLGQSFRNKVVSARKLGHLSAEFPKFHSCGNFNAIPIRSCNYLES